MDERSFQEMRKGLEIQFKYILYRKPGFKFFHSIGNWNFFQRFKSDDGKIDFGVLHVYWDKDAENMIDYVDKEGNFRPHVLFSNGGKKGSMDIFVGRNQKRSRRQKD